MWKSLNEPTYPDMYIFSAYTRNIPAKLSFNCTLFGVKPLGGDSAKNSSSTDSCSVGEGGRSHEINSSTAVLPLRRPLIPAIQLRNKYQQNSLYNPDSNACNSIAAKRQVQSHSPDSASHTNMLPF